MYIKTPADSTMTERVRIGYGRELVDYNPSLPLIVKFAKLNRPPYSPFEEGKLAAKEISDAFGDAPAVCLSGGVDSEAVALAFLAAKVPFDVTTLRFLDGLNSHDIAHAKQFCEDHNIRQNFIDLDIVDFFESKKYLAYQEKYLCPSIEMAAQLWFMEQIKRPFVWGGDAFRLFINNGKPQIQAVTGYDAVVNRFVKHNNLKAIPNFHFYSPELALSFFRESIKVKSNVYSGDGCVEHFSDKVAYYQLCGFDIARYPGRHLKLHGFEQVKIFFDQKLSPLTYNEVYRSPEIRKFPITSSVIVKFDKTDQIAREIMGLAA